MQVKCQICGKSIERSTAYKVVVGDANKYFCSEEEFNAEKARKDHAKEILIAATTANVTAVTEFSGRPVASGKPGPLYARLAAMLDADMIQVCGKTG